MSPPPQAAKVETKAEAEALIPLFQFQRVLNQDQNGRRITLFGSIKDEPAVLTLERAAFPSESALVPTLLISLSAIVNLGTNDIYRWYMCNNFPTTSTSSSLPPLSDLKLNLIYPCTESHVRKYTSQPLRYVTESPEIYRLYIKPHIERTQRTPKHLNWIYNILDGITEQEDIIYRSPDFDAGIAAAKSVDSPPSGFLLLPDLNWDRKTLSGLHLLALVQRRDIMSLRSLRRSHVPWLRAMLAQIKVAAAARGTEIAAAKGSAEVMEPDQVKCYVHYQPTYYHFHIHVVHVMLEPEGGTQSVGKAFGLDALISMLEGLSCEDGDDRGLDTVDVAYHLGEASDIWRKCFAKIKFGERVDLLDT